MKRYKVKRVMESAIADSTRRAYSLAWAEWEKFCARRRLRPTVASGKHVARFLLSLADEGISTNSIRIKLAGVRFHYARAGITDPPTESPEATDAMRAIARANAGKGVRRVDPLREADVLSLLSQCPRSPRGNRDAAIIAVGFACALRRSEIVALRVEDIEFVSSARAVITLRKSKTDQYGAGREIGMPDGQKIKAVTRLRQWLSVSGIESGPVFRSFYPRGAMRDDSVDESWIPKMLKRYAAAAGMNPENISGHSLRAGFITSAAEHGARLDKIMDVSGHASVSTVMRYIRPADRFSQHAGEDFL